MFCRYLDPSLDGVKQQAQKKQAKYSKVTIHCNTIDSHRNRPLDAGQACEKNRIESVIHVVFFMILKQVIFFFQIGTLTQQFCQDEAASELNSDVPGTNYRVKEVQK